MNARFDKAVLDEFVYTSSRDCPVCREKDCCRWVSSDLPATSANRCLRCRALISWPGVIMSPLQGLPAHVTGPVKVTLPEPVT
jgi:hypothetical protein